MNINKETTRFYHLRPATKDGKLAARAGCTVAVNETQDNSGGLITLAAIKFCHPNDNFNRKEGRKKSGWLLDKNAFHDGTLDEKTHVGYDRYYCVAGGLADAVPVILGRVAEQTGYGRQAAA